MFFTFIENIKNMQKRLNIYSVSAVSLSDIKH